MRIGILGACSSMSHTLPSHWSRRQRHGLVLRRPGADDVVEHLGIRTSYAYQLEALAHAVEDGGPVLTDADWSVANVRLVDAAHAATGFDDRPHI